MLCRQTHGHMLLYIYISFFSNGFDYKHFAVTSQLIRVWYLFGLPFWIATLFLSLKYMACLGFVCFRYRRLFIPNEKEKENLVSEQLMQWAGKIFKPFKQSTAVSETVSRGMICCIFCAEYCKCQSFDLLLCYFNRTFSL